MSDATTVLLIDDDPHYREYYALRLHAVSIAVSLTLLFFKT